MLLPYATETTVFEDVIALKFKENSLEFFILYNDKGVFVRNQKPLEILYSTRLKKILNSSEQIHLKGPKVKIKWDLKTLAASTEIEQQMQGYIETTQCLKLNT